MILKDDNKQNDGEETWGDNDDNINADPTRGNTNITIFGSKTDQHCSNNRDPEDDYNDDDEDSSDS